MKTLAVMMAVFIGLALFTREFNWKTRALLICSLIGMVIVLSR